MENLLTLIATGITFWVLYDSYRNTIGKEKRSTQWYVMKFIFIIMAATPMVAVFYYFIREGQMDLHRFSQSLKYTWFILCLVWVVKRIFFRQVAKTK